MKTFGAFLNSRGTLGGVHRFDDAPSGDLAEELKIGDDFEFGVVNRFDCQDDEVGLELDVKVGFDSSVHHGFHFFNGVSDSLSRVTHFFGFYFVRIVKPCVEEMKRGESGSHSPSESNPENGIQNYIRGSYQFLNEVAHA